MAYNPNNPNGQATSANSAPVVIASDQSAVPIADGGGSLTVDGTVGISGTVTVSGTVTANAGTGTQNVSVQNASIPVTDNGGSLTVDGSVSVSNFPATQAVSGTVNVQDGGGSLTVDGTVAATQSGVWDVRTQDGVGNDITSHVAGSARGIDVAILDGSGNQITSFGGGTQYAEGATAATATGTAAMMKDDSDIISPLKGDFTNGLLVNLGANNDINLPYGTIDTFGKLVTSNSRNDVDVQFYRDDPNNILVVTAAGGGTATQSTGYAQFASSTGTTGSIKGVTTDKTHYHSGGEIYAMFAAAWLDGGAASSFQRLGLYDTNNGFYIGYEGTTFGVTIRNGASDTQIAKANFNVDTLSGTAGSKFTRNGTPEAIDLTKLNVFRIRFGWLGAAAVKFEVLSPDDQWVLFHIVRQPNLSATPHIQNADLPMTLEITKTAGATNLRMNSTCWGAGIQYDYMDWSESSTLGTTVGNTIDYDINGLGSASVYVGTTTTGTFIFEVTIDGKNWFTHGGVVDPSIGGTDLLVQGAVTPIAGSYYKIPVTGYKGFRVRTASTLGAAVSMFFVGDTHDIFHDVTPAPHNLGYVFVHKDGEYTTAQTGVALWTPATGKKFVITGMTISTGGTTSGIVTVWQSTTAVGDTTYNAGTDIAIFRGEFAPSANSKPGVIKQFSTPYVASLADYPVRVTTSAAMTVYVQLDGYEI